MAGRDKFILSRLRRCVIDVNTCLTEYIRRGRPGHLPLLLDDLCDVYVELVKPVMYDFGVPRVVVPSLHRYDSCPSHDEVGGFFWILRPFGPSRATAMLRAGTMPIKKVEVGILLNKFCGPVSMRV